MRCTAAILLALGPENEVLEYAYGVVAGDNAKDYAVVSGVDVNTCETEMQRSAAK